MAAERAHAGPPIDPCADSLHPLLTTLTGWVAAEDSSLGYDYCAFACGASLSLAYDARRGFTVAAEQQLLWPGNLFAIADSLYAPDRPTSMAAAAELLLEQTTAGRHCLLSAAEPFVVYAVDSSFGDPWFFVARCGDHRPDSTIWDTGDLRRLWWRWSDLPGANTIWIRPERVAPRIGRSAIRLAMRHLVLAARPDTTGGRHFGLAALQAALRQPERSPGDRFELLRLARLRAAAGAFLTAHADRWAPGEREPVRLAAFYFEKAAEAWRTVGTALETWDDYDVGQRTEWLVGLNDWETRAAVALDDIVSAAE
jgi:hypothetical protein